MKFITMKDLIIYDKINSLPDDLKSEAIDFVDFLLTKAKKKVKKKKPKFGSGKGLFKMSVNFDEPLDDFKEYM